MKALVTGATGFIGRRLLTELEDPIVLTRNIRSSPSLVGKKSFEWRDMEELPPEDAFDGVDTVFHLAGESVSEGHWTKKKERIWKSRSLGTRSLVERLSSLPDPPRTLVTASAVGFYGSRGEEILDEDAAGSDTFLSDVCRDWELAARLGTSSL